MELRIQSLSRDDYLSVRKIHEQYKSEFRLPNFIDHFLFSFKVCDESGEIITTAGVRTILEVIAMTDKNKSVRSRRSALLKTLEVSSFVADKHGYDKVHAFVQNEKWKDQMIRSGFSQTKGVSLVRGVNRDG